MNMSDVPLKSFRQKNGKIYNPKTKRWINDTYANRDRIGIPWALGKAKKLYNPKTKRWIKDTLVNRNKLGIPLHKAICPPGKISKHTYFPGQDCVKDTARNRNRRETPYSCGRKRIYNPRTNRCIKDTTANRKRRDATTRAQTREFAAGVKKMGGTVSYPPDGSVTATFSTNIGKMTRLNEISKNYKLVSIKRPYENDKNVSYDDPKWEITSYNYQIKRRN